jgi:tetratricopeptide (TPR) repeat protein
MNKGSSQDLYQKGYHFYVAGCYKEALSVFQQLLKAQPTQSLYWKAQGACLQLLKEYEQALYSYRLAQAFSHPSDPYLSLYIADCHFALQQVTLGLEALDAAEKQSSNDSNIKHHITLMRERWTLLKMEK